MATRERDEGPLRTCIVTRAERPPEEMIRFVLGPDGMVVPDLRRRLPGRGVWTTGTAKAVAEATKRRAFARSFKTGATAPEGLAELVGNLLASDCLQSLALANKAGLVVSGFAKVEAAVAAGDVATILHASDGGADGKRKLGQALRRRFGADAPQEFETFDSSQLDLALGRTNVIHAALRRGPASDAFIAHARRLQVYRSGEHGSERTRLAADAGGGERDERATAPRTQDE
jgi:uncharacterized protein